MVVADPGRYRAIVEESQAAQRAGGHYGVPMMVFEPTMPTGTVAR